MLIFLAIASEAATNATVADTKVQAGCNDILSAPVIFEHKHQRLFKAGPNDVVVREIYDSSGIAKRDADGGIGE